MTSGEIALIGAAAVVLAAVIGAFATLMSRRPLSLFGERSRLVASARYHWQEQSLMWALPTQLSSEGRALIERSNPFHPTDYSAIELLLAKEGGVKINTLIEGTHAHSEFSPVQLVIQGGARAPMVIREMRARIVSRHSPISSTLVYGPPQGEGAVTEIAFDLDSSDAVARRVNEAGLPAAPYFAGTFLTLQAGESIAFSIRAYTQAFYCEWEIEISAVVNGKGESLIVKDPGGYPFRTTAFSQSYETVYDLDFQKNRFVLLPPDAGPPWD
jgi:hypothetical protein